MSLSVKKIFKAIALTLSLAITIGAIYYGYLMIGKFLVFLYSPVEFLLKKTDELSKLIQKNINQKQMHQMIKKMESSLHHFQKTHFGKNQEKAILDFLNGTIKIFQKL